MSPLIAGFAPDGGLIRIVEAPKAEPASGVKVGPADLATDAKGNVVIAFATLNVVDSDGDVTLPGAFPSKEVPLSAWGHASWQPSFVPLGRGRLSEERGRAIFRGQMFIHASQAAAETFATLRELGPLSEFSYGYNVVDADRGMFEGQLVRFLRKLDVFEVSPVLRGAGVGTGVVEMSSLDPRQLEIAAAARANERELLRLQGFTVAKSSIVGYAPDGSPIRVRGLTGGRK